MANVVFPRAALLVADDDDVRRSRPSDLWRVQHCKLGSTSSVIGSVALQRYRRLIYIKHPFCHRQGWKASISADNTGSYTGVVNQSSRSRDMGEDAFARPIP
jgi:hypothetical protein